GEEERADERAEEETQAGVGRQRRGERGAPALLSGNALGRAEDRAEAKRGDGRLRDEDRAPVERLRQHTPERRPDREAERGGGGPALGAEHRQRRREQQRSAHALDASGADQEAEALRRRARERRREEEPEPGSEHD